MVNQNVENQTPETEELNEKEMEAKKAEITNWYKDNIKHLKVQKEYEELLRDIEKLRAERLQAQQFITQSLANQQAEQQVKQNQAKQDWNPNMNTAPPAPAPARQLKKAESNA
jgi:archaellum component FlaC